MKKLIYLLIVGCSFFFSSCDDVEVGYMVTDSAAYPIDTLYIYDVGGPWEKLMATKDEFEEKAGSFLAEREIWKEETDRRLNERYDFEDDVLDPLYDAYEKNPTPELEKALEEAEIQFDKLYAAWDEANKKYRDAYYAVEEIADEMGIVERDLNNEIARLQNKATYKIPWVTSPIEGILGTEPLRYSIVDVKNESSENAELFRKSLSIIGGGRMYVAFDVKAPVGVYTISIAVENEGHSVVLEDVFTFVVETMEDAEEG